MAASPVEPGSESPSSDRILAETLRSTIEEAIRSSVRTDPRVLAGALFPVLGPAIRLAVQNAFRDTIEALGAIIHRNFTLTGLRWRWEALRTGRPIGEIALLRSVLYRVEHVFVFHRDTGLLMLQSSHPAAPAQSLDVVSAMLTAIQDFVRDSFGLTEDTGLRSIRFGEFQVWAEHGTFASLAAVIRGSPPPDLRFALAETLEQLQREGAREMMAFSGDSEPLKRLGSHLENCLEARYSSQEKPAGRAVRMAFAAALAASAVFLVADLVYGARWKSYLQALGAEPGIVVTFAERSVGKYRLGGLRDPLSADPAEVARKHDVDPHSIRSQWKEYVSMEPALVERRARVLLRPPATVEIQLREGTIAVRGRAPHEWMMSARAMPLGWLGVKRLDLSQATDADMEAIVKVIESESVPFNVGLSRLAPESMAILARVAAEIRKLDALATEAGLRQEVVVFGHSDHTGLERKNVALARERAGRAGLELGKLGMGRAKVIADSGSEDGVRAATFRIRVAPEP
jgi:flagellar motor protein MotB